MWKNADIFLHALVVNFYTNLVDFVLPSFGCELRDSYEVTAPGAACSTPVCSDGRVMVAKSVIAVCEEGVVLISNAET